MLNSLTFDLIWLMVFIEKAGKWTGKVKVEHVLLLVIYNTSNYLLILKVMLSKTK